MWSGLGEMDRAIEMLQDGYKNNRLSESGKSTLVEFLHNRNRYAESVPVLYDLIEIRPDAVGHRTLLMRAYFVKVLI